MTTLQLVIWILVLGAFALICEQMVRLLQSPACPHCGGVTDHKADCPVNK